MLKYPSTVALERNFFYLYLGICLLSSSLSNVSWVVHLLGLLLSFFFSFYHLSHRLDMMGFRCFPSVFCARKVNDSHPIRGWKSGFQVLHLRKTKSGCRLKMSQQMVEKWIGCQFLGHQQFVGLLNTPKSSRINGITRRGQLVQIVITRFNTPTKCLPSSSAEASSSLQSNSPGGCCSTSTANLMSFNNCGTSLCLLIWGRGFFRWNFALHLGHLGTECSRQYSPINPEGTSQRETRRMCMLTLELLANTRPGETPSWGDAGEGWACKLLIPTFASSRKQQLWT